MAGRNLRLLLINDADLMIVDERLDIVTCPDASGLEEIPRLGTWAAHVLMWGSEKFPLPSFDLLLIDIKFELDTTDPPYFGESNGNASAVVTNPFGLLHSLPLVARQAATKMPFVWAIHTANPDAVRRDPIAVLCFGLLVAMERRPGWDGYDVDKMPEYFSTMIENLPPVQAPDQVWRSLMDPYRKRLVKACEGRISIDYDQLDAVIRIAERASRGSQSDLSSLGEKSLTFFAFPVDHEISLRSLFADTKSWTSSVITVSVLPFLGKLSETRKSAEILPQVVACMKALEDDAELNLTKALMKSLPGGSDHEIHGRVGSGVILCYWLRRYWRGEPRGTKDILGDIGHNTDYNRVPRLLAWAGMDLTCGQFLRHLEKDELQPLFRECGRQYCLNILKWKTGKAFPKCLGVGP